MAVWRVRRPCKDHKLCIKVARLPVTEMNKRKKPSKGCMWVLAHVFLSHCRSSWGWRKGLSAKGSTVMCPALHRDMRHDGVACCFYACGQCCCLLHSIGAAEIAAIGQLGIGWGQPPVGGRALEG